MRTQRIQDGEIVLQVVLMAADCEYIEVVGRFVEAALFKKRTRSFGRKLAVVDVLHRLLKTDGDEDAKYDGEEVNEEVPARDGAVVGRMDVDHRGSILWGNYSGFVRLGLRQISNELRIRAGVWERTGIDLRFSHVRDRVLRCHQVLRAQAGVSYCFAVQG